MWGLGADYSLYVLTHRKHRLLPLEGERCRMTDQRSGRRGSPWASFLLPFFPAQPMKAVQRNGSVQYQSLKKTRKDLLTTSTHEPHDTTGKKKEKHKGNWKDKLRERHPAQRAGRGVGHRRRMRFGSRAERPDSLLFSSAFGAILAMFWHCEGLASACLLVSARDFGCSETMGTSGRHQLFWERRGGPGGRKESQGGKT